MDEDSSLKRFEKKTLIRRECESHIQQFMPVLKNQSLKLNLHARILQKTRQLNNKDKNSEKNKILKYIKYKYATGTKKLTRIRFLQFFFVV